MQSSNRKSFEHTCSHAKGCVSPSNTSRFPGRAWTAADGMRAKIAKGAAPTVQEPEHFRIARAALGDQSSAHRVRQKGDSHARNCVCAALCFHGKAIGRKIWCAANGQMRHAEVLTTHGFKRKPSACAHRHDTMDPFNTAQPAEEVEIAAPAPTTFLKPRAPSPERSWAPSPNGSPRRAPFPSACLWAVRPPSSPRRSRLLCAPPWARSPAPSSTPPASTLWGRRAQPLGCARRYRHFRHHQDGRARWRGRVRAGVFRHHGQPLPPHWRHIGPRSSASRSTPSPRPSVAVAQKWAGVQAKDLLRGVQQMTSAKVGDKASATTQFAVPIAIPAGEGGDQTMVQQPLAWCIEHAPSSQARRTGDHGRHAFFQRPDGGPLFHRPGGHGVDCRRHHPKRLWRSEPRRRYHWRQGARTVLG